MDVSAAEILPQKVAEIDRKYVFVRIVSLDLIEFIKFFGVRLGDS